MAGLIREEKAHLLTAERRNCIEIMEKSQNILEKVTAVPKTSQAVAGFLQYGNLPNAFENVCLRGIQLEHVSCGYLKCSYKVPPRLLDTEGHWRASAIFALVDNMCGSCITTCGLPLKVSVDFNFTYITPAKVNDEIEIEARVIGHKGKLSTVVVDLRNKSTGCLVAQARQSMYDPRQSMVDATKRISKL